MTAPGGDSTSAGGVPNLSRFAGFVLLPVVLFAWHLAAVADLASDRLLPTPVDVGRSLVELVQEGYFYDNLWVTLRVVFVGMFFSLLFGIGLAAVLGMTPLLRSGVYPYIVTLNIIPKVALVPLLTITLGFDAGSRTIIVILVAFFPVFLNTLTAIGDADPDRDRLLESLGASRWQRLRMHRFPEGAPAILAGAKLSLTVAFIVAIVAELFILRDGLAYLITTAKITLNTPMMFAVTLTVGVVGAAFYLLADWLERRIVFWERDDAASGGGRKP